MEDLLYKMNLQKYFGLLPHWTRSIIGKSYLAIPNRLKYGKFYNQYRTRIENYFSYNYSDMVKSQEEITLDTVNYAIKHIPYYRDFHPCLTMNDFEKLPIVNKEIIRKDPDSFTNKKLLKKAIRANTGGSSGIPLSFLIQYGITRPKEKAHFDWYWGQFGCKKRANMLMVRGRPLLGNRVMEYQPISNRLAISCYEVNKNNIREVIDAICYFSPKFIHAYPSSLKVLTDSIVNAGVELSKWSIYTIFLGSEYLPESYRIFFEEIYKAKVINWYGHSECLIHGGNCTYHNNYHFYPFYGYMELIDDEGNPINSSGQMGRIVATGYDNFVMPFLRYDTGDFGILSEYKECKCGFLGKTLKLIEGRGQDYIFLEDSQPLSVTAFIFGQHFKEFAKIRQIQVHQNRVGHITILLSVNEDFGKIDEQSMIDQMLNSVSNRLTVNFEYADFIPTTVRGKHKLLVQNINVDTLS